MLTSQNILIFMVPLHVSRLWLRRQSVSMWLISSFVPGRSRRDNYILLRISM